MGRLSKSPDPKTSVTARFGYDLVNEIDELAEALLSDRTTIMQECLKLGVGELVKQRPELLHVLEVHRKRKSAAKSVLKKGSAM